MQTVWSLALPIDALMRGISYIVILFLHRHYMSLKIDLERLILKLLCLLWNFSDFWPSIPLTVAFSSDIFITVCSLLLLINIFWYHENNCKNVHHLHGHIHFPVSNKTVHRLTKHVKPLQCCSMRHLISFRPARPMTTQQPRSKSSRLLHSIDV